jgi:putative FmdB family regulatory protein
MPLYEFICKSCGQHFDKMMRFSESNKSPVCPNCQSLETQKKLSLVSSLGTSDIPVYGGNCSSAGRFT